MRTAVNAADQRFACGSKESDSPPFPFPPLGASRGHRRLRCAAARALRQPKAERSSAFWAGKEKCFFNWGLRTPKPRVSALRKGANLSKREEAPEADEFLKLQAHSSMRICFGSE